MLNLGFGELAVIFIVLIIAVGPDRLPTMMKGLGKTIRTVRQASRDIRATVGIDELLREDVMAPLPKRPVPKAAIARPAAGTTSLPSPAENATDTPPTENAPLPLEAAAGIPGTPSAAPQPPAPQPASPVSPAPAGETALPGSKPAAETELEPGSEPRKD